MATDAFRSGSNSAANTTANFSAFNNYNPLVSVSTGVSNFWPSDVASNSTSPASDHNWDVDEEETIKRRIYELKRQFHNGRYLLLRHLPREATEEDVRELFSGHLVHSVQLHPSNGSARVLLAEPEVLENWPKSSQKTLRGSKVSITPSSTEGLLCVARLPSEYLEEEFAALVAALGPVNFSFLMRSEKTGESKGYGFVEYLNKEIALQAKLALDGRELRDTILVCDWLDPSHVTYASLHSACLYVDRLPKDYRDMGEFRRIFSRVTNPPYCQIAMKQGAIQDWGLVEFNNPEDAEETRNNLNNHKLKGLPIRVEFYVPGIRAIHIYMKLLNEPAHKRKGALLPEPPTNKVFIQLKNLTKHNPAFAKSLQNIILTQIQNLQQNGVTGAPPTPPNGVINGGFAPSDVSTSLRGTQGGAHPPIRIPPPTVSLPHHLQYPPPPIARPSPPASSIEQPLNSNAQAALVILLAAQLQQQQDQLQHQEQLQQQQNNSQRTSTNSILSNPQVLNLLQTLVSQGDPQQGSRYNSHMAASPEAIAPSSTALSNSLKSNFRSGYFKNGVKMMKSPLLPTPSSSSPRDWSPTAEEVPDVDRSVGPLLNGILGPAKEGAVTQGDDLSSSITNLLSNAQSLHKLLGTLTPDCPQPSSAPPCQPSVPPGMMPPPNAVPSSIPGHPPPTLLTPGQPVYQAAPPTDPVMSLLLRAADNGRPPDGAYLSTVEAPPLPVSGAPYLIASMPPQPPPPTTAWSPIAPPPQTLLTAAPAVFSHQAALTPRLYSPIYLTPTRTVAPNQPPLVAAPSPTMGFSTPVGQKRKSTNFLPSPEPSPENGYIGQHSQGIGGHYPESYYSNKKKKH